MPWSIYKFDLSWPPPPAVGPPWGIYGWDVIATGHAHPYPPGSYAKALWSDTRPDATHDPAWYISRYRLPYDVPRSSPVASGISSSGGIMPQNLTFDFDVAGKNIRYYHGTIAVSLGVMWAKGVTASGTEIVATTLSFAGVFGIPIDPNEVATKGRTWGEDRTIYTPTDGPLVDGFNLPTIYPGTATQGVDPLILADKGVENTPAFRDLTYYVYPEFPISAVGSANPHIIEERITEDRIRLDDEIVLVYAKMRPAISVTVTGVENMISGSVYDSIQPQAFARLLNEAYGIDVIDGNPLRFVKRPIGGSLTIDFTRDFSDPADRASKKFSLTRKEDTLLPNQVVIDYIDAARNYDRNTQEFHFPKYPIEYSPSTESKTITLPFSITATEAKQLAAEALHRFNAEAIGATWDDDDLTIEEGDVCEIFVPPSVFTMKVIERQMNVDNSVTLQAEGLLARTGIDTGADSGDLMDNPINTFYRSWELLRPQEFVITGGILYDPVRSVVDPQAGLVHLTFANLSDRITSNQIVLGSAAFFGDAWLAGVDGAYVYQINGTHISRIQRVSPFSTETLTFTIPSGGFREPSLLSDDNIRVVSSASGGSVLYTLDKNNFSAAGATTIDISAGPISVSGIVENADYVVITGRDLDDDTPRIWRVTKADDTVVTDDVAVLELGYAVSDDTFVFIQPQSTTLPYVANATGTKYEITSRAITTFDLDDDITGGRGMPYWYPHVLDGTTLAFLVAEQDADYPNIGPVYLVTRSTPALTPVAQFNLSDIPGYDPNTYQPSWMGKITGFYVVAGTYFRAEGGPFGSEETFIAKIADDLSAGTVLLPAPPDPPVNDNFADAISASTAFANLGSTARATKEVGEDNHGGEVGGMSAWWVFTAPSTDTFRFDASLTDWPCVLAVYSGTAVGALTEINSGVSGSVGVSVDAALTSGVVYHIAIDGKQDSSDRCFGGDVSFTIAAV